MRAVIALSALLLGSCTAVSEWVDSLPEPEYAQRYWCYSYDYPAKHVLTLPRPHQDHDVVPVEMLFSNDTVNATYNRNGLSQYWVFEDSLYVKLDPDAKGQYWNFQGAEEDEYRRPEAVFECHEYYRGNETYR